ncbi:chemotaxis protein CheW [Thermodesulfobacterium hveragerdense]|uniref:chemotaxis protein CheW n=1 Tax=Thermodesulfobacterium hveragerdense TaxID=53424 RepID=UPI0004266CB8|nr:chemotaxis protein CheW [Thermodesulfobacterium hveragerdense]
MEAELMEPQLYEEEKINEYVSFFIEEEVFALPMAPVQEIIRVPQMVRVPKAPSTLLGLANLRGNVLPVINLRKVFGIAEREIDETSRVIVLNMGQILGFLVDRVSSVINVDDTQIEDSSEIKSIVRSEFLKGVIKVSSQDKMVTLVKRIVSPYKISLQTFASIRIKQT